MNKIPGGAFIVARKIFQSDLWVNKPASWKVIWIYILGKVNHTARGDLDVGEGFFNFSKELKQIDIECTPDKIKKFLRYAKGGPGGRPGTDPLISTRKSTRGIIIKVLKYSEYQDLYNYRSTDPSTQRTESKHQPSTTIYNNEEKREKKKEEPFDDFERYEKEDKAFIEKLMSGAYD